MHGVNQTVLILDGKSIKDAENQNITSTIFDAGGQWVKIRGIKNTYCSWRWETKLFPLLQWNLKARRSWFGMGNCLPENQMLLYLPNKEYGWLPKELELNCHSRKDTCRWFDYRIWDDPQPVQLEFHGLDIWNLELKDWLAVLELSVYSWENGKILPGARPLETAVGHFKSHL